MPVGPLSPDQFMIISHNTLIVRDLGIGHLSFFFTVVMACSGCFLHSSVEVVRGERTIKMAYFIIEIGDIMYELTF